MTKRVEVDWLVEKNQVFKGSIGDKTLLSQEEFWNNRISDSESPIGLNILGFASVALKVKKIKQGNKICLVFHTDLGKFDVEDLEEIPTDHIVIDRNWYPLHLEQMLLVKSIFDKEKLSLKNYIDYQEYLKLVKIKNNTNISVSFDFDISDFFESMLFPNISSRLVAKPYHYQKEGIAWLTTMFRQKSGALLADEMGLGKTLQILGLLANIADSDEAENIKVLIIVPSSLTLNWNREFKKFLPTIIPYIHKGSDRIVELNEFEEKQIVITTYDLIKRDSLLFNSTHWDVVICDEAQALKNRNSQQHMAVQELNSTRKFLVTGTPIENSLKDIWSLISTIRPGLMGDFNTFTKYIEDDLATAFEIGNSIKSLILRRRVLEVGSQLPEIVYIDEPLEYSPNFANSYEKVRKGVLQELKGKPTLGNLTKLRQFCCYPVIVDRNFDPDDNPKMDRLLEILDEIYFQGEDQVIIFSSYQDSNDYIRHCIKSRYGDLWIGVIDGRSTADERDEQIQEFSRLGKFSVLLISPKAGGAGLNITAANHVIHYNLEWNPAIESQATARAWRTGQKKTVFVHRFFYINTLEEIIYEKSNFKSELASSALKPAEEDNYQKDYTSALTISPILK